MGGIRAVEAEIRRLEPEIARLAERLGLAAEILGFSGGYRTGYGSWVVDNNYVGTPDEYCTQEA